MEKKTAREEQLFLPNTNNTTIIYLGGMVDSPRKQNTMQGHPRAPTGRPCGKSPPCPRARKTHAAP